MAEYPEQSTCWCSLVSGVFVGAMIGAAISLLYAPKPGKEMRDDLTTRMADVKERIDRLTAEVGETSRARLADVKSDLMHAMDAGRTAAAERAAELRQQVGLE